MSETRVSNRYAKSLLDLAREKNSVEQVFGDISSFKTALDKNPALANLMKSPIVNGDKKLAVVKQLFANAFNPVTMTFFEIVIRKKREYFAYDIAQAFIEQYNSLNNITTASVVTAVSLSDSNQQEIQSLIEKGTGKKVILSTKVDPSLIGGLVVQIEGKLLDASISGKLRKAKQELINTYISK
ncbi:MAG: ATP synthase F1 subunit delta [Bacteroidia bacterium]|nr:ATP synthase F1 subunit delta [Bacteroidia bacterium]